MPSTDPSPRSRPRRRPTRRRQAQADCAGVLVGVAEGGVVVIVGRGRKVSADPDASSS